MVKKEFKKINKCFFGLIIFIFINGFFIDQAQASRETNDLPDLDVTFIARTPRYEKYHTEKGLDDQYRLKPGTENFQRWPAKDELVTFSAQITNQGDAVSGNFTYRWYVDGLAVATGTHDNINPGSYATTEYLWRWQDGTHTIKLVVDPDDAIEEVSEQNNQLEDRTNALSLIFHVEEGFCVAFDQQKNNLDSYSCEDWLQLQVRALNQLLADSIYDSAQNGALTRIRLDQIYIHKNGEINAETSHQDWLYDGSWSLPWDDQGDDCQVRSLWCADDDYVETYVQEIDWNLLRNLAQRLLNLIDLSHLSVQTADVHLTDENSLKVAGSVLMPEVTDDFVFLNRHQGLMNSVDEHKFSEYEILAINRLADYYTDSLGQKRGLPKRAGTYDYLKDMPVKNNLLILDKNGQPLPRVGIAVFQESAYGFENMIKYSGGTSSSGIWTFPSKTASTYWGKLFSAQNPFSYAKLNDHSQGEVAGYVTVPYPTNGLYDTGLIIRLSANGHLEYHFLDITDFNLAFWKGNHSEGTHTLQTDFESITANQYIVTGTKPGGGPQVRIFDPYGNLVRQFMAFEANFRGGIDLAQADVNGDNETEIIAASGSGRRGEVRIFDKNGIYQTSLIAFDVNFTGGISLAAGNLDGGNSAEIVVAPQSAGGPNVRIFGYRNGQYVPTTENFMAYDKNFRGGVNLAVGDLEGDGLAEIITAPRSQGGPQLRIFGYRNGVYQPVILGLMAYSTNFQGGVNLACGDLNSDGADEIITGVVGSGSPHVRIFGRNRQKTISLLNPGFMAFASNFQGGTDLASSDLDNDSHAEIIVGANSQSMAVVRVYHWQGKLLLNEFLGYPENYQSGLNLSSGSID